MSAFRKYLRDLRENHSTGAATKETSYYPALSALLDSYGKRVKPRVKAVMNIKNQGAGFPDSGLFTSNQFQGGEEEPIAGLPPERGVIEVKGPQDEVFKIAKTKQVRDYLDRYGLVLVTNLREFLVLRSKGLDV